MLSAIIWRWSWNWGDGFGYPEFLQPMLATRTRQELVGFNLVYFTLNKVLLPEEEIMPRLSDHICVNSEQRIPPPHPTPLKILCIESLKKESDQTTFQPRISPLSRNPRSTNQRAHRCTSVSFSRNPILKYAFELCLKISSQKVGYEFS